LAATGFGVLGAGIGSALLSEGSATAATAAPSRVVRPFTLTFDDGPHTAPLGVGTNRTERVLDLLKRQGVRGAFFIQTGVDYRGNHPIGRELTARMAADGHTVGIHTGGTVDHELHTVAQRDGRLERELLAASEYIRLHTGHTPTYVRPTGGTTNAAVLKTYAKLGLTSLLWDIDGDQGRSLGVTELEQRLRDGLGVVAGRDWAGTTTIAPRIVLLYHDIQAGTSTNTGVLIDRIRLLTTELDQKHGIAAFRTP
jgi:peptidoglycan/xylan/chitin deacetylase (PgdA/CDA1 family)